MKIKYLQTGGDTSQMPQTTEPQTAPQGGGEDPTKQIIAAAVQAAQSNDANMALEVCKQIAAMMGGQSAQPAQQAPALKKGGVVIKTKTGMKPEPVVAKASKGVKIKMNGKKASC
jgi:hypothetical protein